MQEHESFDTVITLALGCLFALAAWETIKTARRTRELMDMYISLAQTDVKAAAERKDEGGDKP